MIFELYDRSLYLQNCRSLANIYYVFQVNVKLIAITILMIFTLFNHLFNLRFIQYVVIFTHLESSNIRSIFSLYIEFRLTLELFSSWSPSSSRKPEELLLWLWLWLLLLLLLWLLTGLRVRTEFILGTATTDCESALQEVTIIGGDGERCKVLSRDAFGAAVAQLSLAQICDELWHASVCPSLSLLSHSLSLCAPFAWRLSAFVWLSFFAFFACFFFCLFVVVVVFCMLWVGFGV